MSEAKTHLSKLLQRFAGGEGVIIMRAGKPVARLLAIQAQTPVRRVGSAAGDFQVSDDFDAPLPEGVLSEFE